MRSIGRWSTLLAACALAACSEQNPLDPAQMVSGEAALVGADRISVLSRNLYVGADLTPAIGALASPDPTDDLPAILATVGVINATDWQARAQALAGEIIRTRPHVVGLQEVWTVNVNIPPLGVAVNLDFLNDIMGALAAAGMPYKIAAIVTSIEAQPNAAVGVTDRDLILVDTTRVSYDPASVVARTFTFNVGTIAPNVELLRGWVTVNAVVDGIPVTIASTHLESGRSVQLSGLRAAQAQELVASLTGSNPAILLGDLNDDEGSPMYQVVTGAGFRDAWREMRPGVEGFTCCHAENLSNASASETFDQRIDYVFTRGLEFRNDRVLGTISLLGLRASERLNDALWPSDHAGVLASVLLPPSR